MEKSQKLTKKYDVCKNGCYLYEKEDATTTVCPSGCGENRYKPSSRTPQQQMTCVSIGAALAEMLYDDDTRDLFLYKSDCDSGNSESLLNGATGNHTDIFSGEIYKELVNSRVIDSNDICLVFYVDGYEHKHKSNHSCTMINCLVMNFDPSIR